MNVAINSFCCLKPKAELFFARSIKMESFDTFFCEVFLISLEVGE